MAVPINFDWDNGGDLRETHWVAIAVMSAAKPLHVCSSSGDFNTTSSFTATRTHQVDGDGSRSGVYN